MKRHLIAATALLLVCISGPARLEPGRQADETYSIYCCDLEGNCIASVDGAPCNPNEVGTLEQDDRPETVQESRNGLELTMTDYELTQADDSYFQGTRGDLYRHLKKHRRTVFIGIVRVHAKQGVRRLFKGRQTIMTRCEGEVVERLGGIDNSGLVTGSIVSYYMMGGVVENDGMSYEGQPQCDSGSNYLVILWETNSELLPAFGGKGAVLISNATGKSSAEGLEIVEFIRRQN